MESKFIVLHGHTFKEIYKKSPCVLDLGSNKGKFTSAFLEKYPDSRVICVEPNPDLVQFLIKKFYGQNVSIINLAVGSFNLEKIPFYINKNDEASSLFNPSVSILRKFIYSYNTNTKKIFVESNSLQNLISNQKLKYIDLIKLDVEGAEWDILLSLTESDVKLISQISVEFHDFLDTSKKSLTLKTIDHLSKLRFSVKESLMRGNLDVLFFKD